MLQAWGAGDREALDRLTPIVYDELRHLARRHNLKRGGDVLALDDAMNELVRLDPRKARVVEMRFLGGLNLEETAEALKISTKTVQRDWNLARGWLYDELSGKKQDG